MNGASEGLVFMNDEWDIGGNKGPADFFKRGLHCGQWHLMGFQMIRLN